MAACSSGDFSLLAPAVLVPSVPVFPVAMLPPEALPVFVSAGLVLLITDPVFGAAGEDSVWAGVIFLAQLHTNTVNASTGNIFFMFVFIFFGAKNKALSCWVNRLTDFYRMTPLPK
jgi:hypothetical protein